MSLMMNELECEEKWKNECNHYKVMKNVYARVAMLHSKTVTCQTSFNILKFLQTKQTMKTMSNAKAETSTVRTIVTSVTIE